MDVSCHSFIRMARIAEPLMAAGGCLLTVTFYGSEKIVEEYNVMRPVKARGAVRYIAAELGPKRIRVHASPGPLKTRAVGLAEARVWRRGRSRSFRKGEEDARNH
jgi:enoyl-[acyl-carrier protein] reductase I